MTSRRKLRADLNTTDRWGHLPVRLVEAIQGFVDLWGIDPRWCGCGCRGGRVRKVEGNNVAAVDCGVRRHGDWGDRFVRRMKVCKSQPSQWLHCVATAWDYRPASSGELGHDGRLVEPAGSFHGGCDGAAAQPDSNVRCAAMCDFSCNLRRTG